LDALGDLLRIAAALSSDQIFERAVRVPMAGTEVPRLEQVERILTG